MPTRLHGVQTALLVLAAVPFAIVVGTPIVAIFVRVLPTGALWTAISRPVVVDALRLSAFTTMAALVLAVGLGTPLAYLLARRQFPGRTLLDSLVELPMVLPPAVAGIGLLMAFGRRGLVGEMLAEHGIVLGFTTAAVVLA